MNAIQSGLYKTNCKCSAKFAFATATYERTNRCKTTDMSRTYLDVTCAESCLEPPFSQMSSMEIYVILHLFVRSYVAVTKVQVVEYLHFVLSSPD